MPQACQVCNNPNRLQIDREIIDGKSKSGIASRYGVPGHSVSYHAENHLSRQLVQAWERKDLAENTDLLARIDKIIDRAEKIFKRNYDKESISGDTLALKALGEQRSTIELLAKISAYLHQARVLELQNSQEHLAQEQQARTKEAMERLSFDELEVMLFLQRKMDGETEGLEVPDVFKAPRPPLPPPLPPPRPETPPTTDSTPVYTDEQADPGLTPGPEPEPEPVQEKPRRLPPQHVTEIGEASRDEQKQFANELRRGNVRR
jgi:hypothetical protein